MAWSVGEGRGGFHWHQDLPQVHELEFWSPFPMVGHLAQVWYRAGVKWVLILPQGCQTLLTLQERLYSSEEWMGDGKWEEVVGQEKGKDEELGLLCKMKSIFNRKKWIKGNMLWFFNICFHAVSHPVFTREFSKSHFSRSNQTCNSWFSIFRHHIHFPLELWWSSTHRLGDPV